MKQFKFKDYVFKHMFPYYYKQYDTYKVLEGDDKGKGILERFIDVCSEYLDKEVIPDIDKLSVQNLKYLTHRYLPSDRSGCPVRYLLHAPAHGLRCVTPSGQ